ncbi:hypothetical protein GBAR_LOCUS13949 [Geodia barretti]|uniref:Ig-like domain-containing protein n=1 Tax=Geodia barretti TaxID=519541 RepID=A0AA35WRN7_GEOBA|nr:hypothetical protein GBAR_LOCUS13949 [Geodia barretti]
MYVQRSYYIRDRAVANNSFILKGTMSSTYINVYCYSNSTSGGTGYFKLSDGVRQYSTSNYNNYRIGQLSNTGVSIARYSSSYYPQIFGIFTCEVPDSRGVTVETSIGIYSSMPSPPSVYSISYSERHQASNDGVLGTVDYLSQNSPPTNVTWTRDGSTIEVDGEGYEMMQMVTERQSYSRYRNTLLIKDAAELAGNHSFCCRVSNAAGTTYQCVATSWTAQPDVHIVTYGKNVHSETFECSSTYSTRARGRARWWVVDGTAPGGHVALAPGAVHAGEIPADRLRMVVDFSRLLRQGHEPPVGVKLCVRWRRGRGRARGERFVGETQRRFPSVDSVHLGSAFG